MRAFYRFVGCSDTCINKHYAGAAIRLAGAGLLLVSHVELLSAEAMAYFDNPKQAVDTITKLLVSSAWEELSTYYDLSGTGVDRSRLISGEYFVRENVPEVGHPAGSAKYKEPFAPGFSYQSHSTRSDGVVVVTVGVEIDQGGGMIQRGVDNFLLRKSSNGYQLVPEPASQIIPDSPTTLPESTTKPDWGN
jgi:hypothetical protein